MGKAKKARLDLLLTRKGYYRSRERSRRAIMAGDVIIDGRPATKPGHQYREDAVIKIKEKPRYVSRGGDKLAGALEDFSLPVGGKTALDAGASTGGFTDCLLRAGARRVYCFDVGKGQLDWSLRRDSRVIVREGYNIRYLKSADIEEKPDLVTVDVSFISLALVLPPLEKVLGIGGNILALIKPQFEAGREKVGRGGVVRDPAVHREVIEKIKAFSRNLGLNSRGIRESKLEGPAGNKEFFILLNRG